MDIKEIKYINKESNKQITLPIDKKMIFIYGKNGSGKTTLSRSVTNDAAFVFNEAFIYNNVYIISENGAITNQNTKNNFSELLIGEEEIFLKKKIQKFEEFKKEIADNLKVESKSIDEQLLKYGLTGENNILLNEIDKSFIYNYEKDIDEQIKKYNFESKLHQSIRNKNELDLKVNQLNKQENLLELNKQIDSNNILKAYLFSNNAEIKKINDSISNIKTNEGIISKLENIAKEKNISNEHFDIIRACLDIQKQLGEDKCFLCGTTGVKNKINEWNEILNDKVMKEKYKTIEELNYSIKLAELIIKSKDIYTSVAPKTINCIEKYINEIKEIILSINDKKYILLKENKDELDSNIKETKELKESIRNYLLAPFEKKFIFLNSLDLLNQKTIKKYKDELDKLLEKNSKNNEESINKILTALGLNKEMVIGIDHLGGKVKYKIDLRDGNINTLSDGQKHKLALAIFLNYIKDKELDKKIIIFDDPVVSLDESGYHLFKNYIIQNVMNKDLNKSPTLIILTHNFNYLYVQISNIISNENLRKNSIIYKLSSSNIQVLDFHYFELDDIALFKECLKKMKYKFQLNDMSSIYLKIFRIFLDLSLRIKGIPDTLEIHDELAKLDLDSNDTQRLKIIHQELCSVSKNPNVNFDKSKNGLKLLKEATDILGYRYITDEEISLSNKLKNSQPFYEDDIFFILKQIIEILFSKSEKKYSNYLNHPRISFTQNILATSMNQ